MTCSWWIINPDNPICSAHLQVLVYSDVRADVYSFTAPTKLFLLLDPICRILPYFHINLRSDSKKNLYLKNERSLYELHGYSDM